MNNTPFSQQKLELEFKTPTVKVTETFHAKRLDDIEAGVKPKAYVLKGSAVKRIFVLIPIILFLFACGPLPEPEPTKMEVAIANQKRLDHQRFMRENPPYRWNERSDSEWFEYGENPRTNKTRFFKFHEDYILMKYHVSSDSTWYTKELTGGWVSKNEFRATWDLFVIHPDFVQWHVREIGTTEYLYNTTFIKK